MCVCGFVGVPASMWPQRGSRAFLRCFVCLLGWILKQRQALHLVENVEGEYIQHSPEILILGLNLILTGEEKLLLGAQHNPIRLPFAPVVNRGALPALHGSRHPEEVLHCFFSNVRQHLEREYLDQSGHLGVQVPLVGTIDLLKLRLSHARGASVLRARASKKQASQQASREQEFESESSPYSPGGPAPLPLHEPP